MATYNIQLTEHGRDIRQVQKLHPTARVTKVNRNPSRADRFADVTSHINDALEEARSLAEEMREWADNMPENLQGGEKHSEVEEAADALDEIVSSLEEHETGEVNFPGMM